MSINISIPNRFTTAFTNPDMTRSTMVGSVTWKIASAFFIPITKSTTANTISNVPPDTAYEPNLVDNFVSIFATPLPLPNFFVATSIK